MDQFSINYVIKITGLSRTAVRYYESRGLICPKQNEKTGYRYYTTDDISKIMFYQSLKKLNISVKEYADVISNKTGDFDMMSLILEKKSIYMRNMVNLMNMWDDTLAISLHLHSNEYYCCLQKSRAVWTYQFGSCSAKQEKLLLDNWNNCFLERNLSFFFQKADIQKEKYSYVQGLSCYADCALIPEQEMKEALTFFPSRQCVILMLPFDLNVKPFQQAFHFAQEKMCEFGCFMSGEPWGHIGYRDEAKGVSANYLFLSIPVTLGVED